METQYWNPETGLYQQEPYTPHRRFVQVKLELDEETERAIRKLTKTRERFPWLVKILEPIAKWRGW